MTTMRVAGLLIRLACRGLPGPEREVRYREWTAEVAAILADPGTRSRPGRKIRALLFAADHIRGARRLAGPKRIPYPVTNWRALRLTAFQLGTLTAAGFGTRWLPFAPVGRFAMFELALVAGMAFQVIRERRHWLVETKAESDRARLGQVSILIGWWTMQSIAVAHWLALNLVLSVELMAASSLIWVLLLRWSPVMRWMFGAPGQLKHRQP